MKSRRTSRLISTRKKIELEFFVLNRHATLASFPIDISFDMLNF